MSLASDLDARNAAVRQWNSENIPLLKAEMQKLGIKKYSGAMMSYLKSRFYFTQQKDIRGIGYKMPRHAVFVHKGVGLGYGINGVTTKALGGKKRIPKPWFNNVIDKRIPILADEVAKYDADVLANNIFIK